MPTPPTNLDLHTISPLDFAFVGDAVFELLVREHILQGGNLPVHKLHEKSVAIVNAKSQSKLYDMLTSIVTAEELAKLKQGRNADVSHTPKNTDVADYKKATAVECLFGWLYLKGDRNRVDELFAKIINFLEK